MEYINIFDSPIHTKEMYSGLYNNNQKQQQILILNLYPIINNPFFTPFKIIQEPPRFPYNKIQL